VKHVLVIGAGPAGLSAAVAARDAGALVTLLDSGDGLGGQYWRHLPPQRPSRRESRLHHGWAALERLRASLADDAIEVVTEAQVWAIETTGAAGSTGAAGRFEPRRNRDAGLLGVGPTDPTDSAGADRAVDDRSQSIEALDAGGGPAASALGAPGPADDFEVDRERFERGARGDREHFGHGARGDRGGPGNRLTVHVLVGPADSGGRQARALTADAIVLATGAHDRTLPFPGWHLPGVFSAGAAQALAKGERIAVGRRAVVAGAGPFLLPVAQSLTAAGAHVVGVYEAARPAALAKGWVPKPWRLLAASHKGPELAGYVTHHLAHRVPYRLGHAVVEARGDGRVEEVVIARLGADWAPIAGTERIIAADAVCVSHGFTPRLELPIAAGCAIGPDRFVAVDGDQRTSVAGVYAAGEITGIGGVDAALVEGRIAGCRAAGAEASAADLRRRRGTTDFARRIDAAHGIRPGWVSWLRDDTVVCRCEEVPYGRLRETTEATDQTSLRSVKLTTRAGLGICQARMCGRTVEDLTGAGSARAEDSTDRRPLAAPVRLGDLAGLATTLGKDPNV
jgi:NADPH-dependent 2,4-dienoyl-CoA reductase/sulfur reductase-like enzyme